MTNSHRAIERVARESYGRLVAFLATRSHDLSSAEDALSDAFASAIDHWSLDGIPDNPEAWLLTAARRKLIDQSRRLKSLDAALPAIALANIARAELSASLSAAEHACCSPETFPDERIKLLFVCAHPAIDPAIRTALMLQTVLGLNAATIASAFLITPRTMSQRLVRAKAKIRNARIGFRVPNADELPARLDAVLETIYAAFTLGWDVAADPTTTSGQLTDEAIWLARIVLQLMPQSAEARGLLSLMLFCESRRAARRDTHGDYVPLSQQDTTLWSAPLIVEAEQLLFAAAEMKQIGHFQIEAAIQSAHVERWHARNVNQIVLDRVPPAVPVLDEGQNGRVPLALPVLDEGHNDRVPLALPVLDEGHNDRVPLALPVLDEGHNDRVPLALPVLDEGQNGRVPLALPVLDEGQNGRVPLALPVLTNWPQIARMYEALIAINPTTGALIGRAAAVTEADSPAAGLELLDQLRAPQAANELTANELGTDEQAGAEQIADRQENDDRRSMGRRLGRGTIKSASENSPLSTYQPYWALRAHLLKRLGRNEEAREAYLRAIGLTEDASQRRFLQRQMG